MSQKVFILLLLTAVFLSGLPLQAQQKIAYVDIAAIMKALPEAQESQRKLDAQVDLWQKELDGLEKEWQTKFNDYDKRKLILTDQGRANTEKDLQDLDRRIKQYQDQKFGQSGELFKLEEQLMKPIQDLVFDQVKILGVELGYDYIFDKSGGVMIIYAKETYDLTKKAIERIEKTLPPRSMPNQQQQPGQQQPGMKQGERPPDMPPPPIGQPNQDGSVPAGQMDPQTQKPR